MKRVFKRVTPLLLALTCCFMVCKTDANAAQLNSTFNVKFLIIDSTDGYKGNDFTVTMNDVMGEANKEIKITKAASWGNTTGNIPTISVPAPTTYNITISGLNDGYKLHDYMSGKDIDTTFAATNNGETTFYWEIIKDDGSTSATTAETVSTAGATTNVVANNSDAEKVYEEFLNTISFIQTDDSWSSMLDGYSYPSLLSTFSEMYANCVSAGDKSHDDMVAEYESMSNYDKFLWVSTYLFMADSIKNGHSDNVQSFEKICSNSACPIDNMKIGNRTDADKVVAAYEKLLQWQADYIAANGSPFNFINNRSYLDEVGSASSTVASSSDDSKISSDEDNKKSEEEIKNARKEIEKAENTEGEEKDRGIWADTLDILSSNLITILILVVLLGALGYVIYLKKKNNYTDEIHEKK